VVVCDKTNGGLDENLSFCLGFISPDVEDPERLSFLAQRVASDEKQITGRLLNQVARIYIEQKVSGAEFSKLKELYDAEDKENQEDVVDVDTKIVEGTTYVGERKSLIPAITVTSGNFCEVI
jgi:hypothetical protein